jgi:hypothetical protein
LDYFRSIAADNMVLKRTIENDWSIWSLLLEFMTCAAIPHDWEDESTVTNLEMLIPSLHKQTGADLTVTKYFLSDIYRLAGPKGEHHNVEDLVTNMADQLKVFSSRDLKANGTTSTNNATVTVHLATLLPSMYKERMRSDSSMLSTAKLAIKKEMGDMKKDVDEFLDGMLSPRASSNTISNKNSTLASATSDNSHPRSAKVNFDRDLALALQLSMEEERNRQERNSVQGKKTRQEENDSDDDDAAARALQGLKAMPAMQGVFLQKSNSSSSNDQPYYHADQQAGTFPDIDLSQHENPRPSLTNSTKTGENNSKKKNSNQKKMELQGKENARNLGGFRAASAADIAMFPDIDLSDHSNDRRRKASF